MPDIVVKRSRIHGTGVFAGRAFRNGETVIDWSTCSEKLTRAEVARLSDEEKRYVSRLDGDTFVRFRSPGKHVNHSCDSNTKAKGGADVAVRDIKKGEEITADYALEEVPTSFACRCGSKDCRGRIGDA